MLLLNGPSMLGHYNFLKQFVLMVFSLYLLKNHLTRNH